MDNIMKKNLKKIIHTNIKEMEKIEVISENCSLEFNILFKMITRKACKSNFNKEDKQVYECVKRFNFTTKSKVYNIFKVWIDNEQVRLYVNSNFKHIKGNEMDKKKFIEFLEE